MTELQQLKRAEEYVQQNLRALCEGLLLRQKGKFDHVKLREFRNLSDLCMFAGNKNFAVAEDLVKTAAIQHIVDDNPEYR